MITGWPTTWLAAPAGEPSRQAVDSLLAGVGGAPPVPWEFEGLATILSLVARGIGIAAVPALTLVAADAAPPGSPGTGDGDDADDEDAGDETGAGAGYPAENPIAVRGLPGTLARDIYAVARAASVRRPSVAVVLTALISAAARMTGTTSARAAQARQRDGGTGRREG